MAGEKLIEVVTCSEVVPEVKNGADAVIFADPGATPFSCGALNGCVDPDGMVTVAGETPTLVESELERVTVTPPAGAAEGSVTCNGVNCPITTDGFAVRVIAPAPCTATEAVALVTLGLEAVMMTDPVVIPETANVVADEPAAIETEAGMETIPAWLADKVTVITAAVEAGKVSVRFCGLEPTSVKVEGERLSEPGTLTTCVPGV